MIVALLAPALAGVLINEVLYDSDADSDGNNEWIELCNDGGSAVDLTGWVIESGGSTFGECYTFGAASIPAGGYLVIGGGVDVDLPTDFGNASSGGLQNGGSESDGVRLLDDAGNVVDTLIYDGPNHNGLVDDAGRTTDAPYAADAGEGQSLARANDCGPDTDDSSVDFVVDDSPTPGAANETGGGGDDTDTPSGEADCTGADAVRINEFSTATGQEWVELYNPGGSALDVTGWVVAYAKSGGFTELDVPAATLPAEGWLTLGVDGSDVVVSMDLGNSAGALELRCNGVRVDTAIYGANGGGFTEDDGTVPVSGAPAPGDGESAGRVPDGDDSDVSASDFVVLAPPTPSDANPRCEPGNPAVRINEFLPDPASTDDGSEWVEIHNGGDSEAVLDGYSIQTATSEWGTDFTFPGGTTLAPGAFLVVGGANVSEADLVAESLSLGNAGSSGDGVRLVDCDGVPVDVVIYGSAAAEAAITADGGFDGLAPTDEEVSTGRAEDGVDTDDAADWRLFLPATPGAPNAAGDGDDTGNDDDGGGCGGCGGPKAERPGVDRPAATGLLPFGLFGTFFGAAALRRRR